MAAGAATEPAAGDRRVAIGIAVLAALLAAVAVAIHLPALRAPYVLDDIPAVVENDAAHWPPDLARIATTNYWGDRAGYATLTIYRPLATLSFALVDGMPGGRSPEAQRAFNIALHAACTAALLLLLLSLGAGVLPAALAALLFAVHPVHSEAVIGVVSRAELLAALMVLLGAWVHVRSEVSSWRRRILVWLLLLFALLSKENGVALWGVIAALDLARVLERRGQALPSAARVRIDWVEHAGLAVVLAAYILLRHHVLSGVLAGDLSPADNPIAACASFECRWLSPFKVFFWYLRLLVAPVDLTIDYSANHFKVASGLADPEALAGLVLFAGMAAAAFLLPRRNRIIAAALLAFFATYSVVSNLPFLSTVVMAERLIYLPSAFFVGGVVSACVIALGASSPSPVGGGRGGGISLPRPAIAVAIVTLLAVGSALAARTCVRLRDWESPRSLYEAAVETAPDSAKSQHLLANELVRAGAYEAAGEHYRAALAQDPENFVARTNYARGLAHDQDYDRALDELRTVLSANPRYRPAFVQVCAIWERTGKPPAAARYCRQ